MASAAKSKNAVEIFSYIARDQKASVVKGEIKAIEERIVLEQLKKMGLDPISITVKKVSVFEKLDVNVFDSVPPDSIYNFSRQLSVMLKAGVPLIDALESMLSKTINPLLNKTIKKIIEDISGGATLSNSLEKHPKVFDTMYINIIRAGESSGVLETVLFKLADFISYDLQLTNGIKQAIRYPMIVIGITVTVGFYAVAFILPRFSVLFSQTGIELPLPTRILLGIDTFLQNYSFYLITGIAILAGLFFHFKRTKKGAIVWDRFKINAPVFGKIFKNMAISRFCHVLETLNRTGVPILESLTISSRSTGNSYVQHKLANTKSDVGLGHKIAKSLDKYGSDIFEAQQIKMIQVGEEAASLDDMLVEIALMVDNETQTRVRTLTSTLEPIITVIMGAMILVLALSIFLPIWDMYESLANN